MVNVGRGRRHLLTVLHAAERTGPPLFALQYLRWLRQSEPGWRFSTVFLDAGGPLEAEFAELGPAEVAGTLAPSGPGRRLVRRAQVTAGHARLRRRLARHGAIDLVHVHCAGSFKCVPALPPAPVLGHLHELSVGQDFHLGPLARRYVATADHYVAVSDGVRSEFLARFGVPATSVERQWGFVDPARIPDVADRSVTGLPQESFVVMAAGVRNWRKAPELFVRVAQRAATAAPEVDWRFVWIGGADASGLDGLIARAGLADLVTFLPHQPEALRWIAAADAFLLTAREDAFPLVCVEAAASGCPIVTFDNGGAADLVTAAGCGSVAPFLDLDAAAETLVDLARDPVRRRELGAAGAAFARSHLLLDQAGPALLDAMERTMAGARS